LKLKNGALRGVSKSNPKDSLFKLLPLLAGEGIRGWVQILIILYSNICFINLLHNIGMFAGA
jgi:hypothetical protein